MSKQPRSTVRFISFPSTDPPPVFVTDIINAFRKCESQVCTTALPKGLTSDRVLAVIRDDLVKLGFQVEGGKLKADKIERPVFYGENGEPTLNYQIDAYHPIWKCGLEVEAGRAWMGNAIYRDLIQAMVMVQVEHLCLAVPNAYKYTLKKSNKQTQSNDYDNAVEVVRALYGHTRVTIPYGLTLIGY